VLVDVLGPDETAAAWRREWPLFAARSAWLNSSVLVASGVLIALGLALPGCQQAANTTPKSAGTSAARSQRRTDRGDVLFNSVVQQLRDLPSYVDTDLQPPVVILDAKKSGNGQDVLAVCTTNPDNPEGPINHLLVPGGNSRFRSLGVRPGDVVKYYVLFDQESLETGITQSVAMDLGVAQVLSDNALLIESGLSQAVLEPTKIEVWRYVDDRLKEIAQLFDLYREYRKPVFDWEPSPDSRVLKQMVERLNQWLRQSPPKVDWTADPLLSTVDPQLAADERLAPLISAKALADLAIQPDEARQLQEAVWLRDISRWAQGAEFDDVARATALFDWTVRNVQLDADDEALPYRPWETVAFGHGTAEQRAWVFARLCRQQGLDVVVLSLPASDGSGHRFWLPALVNKGQLYLFDSRLGLPVPGPNGQGVATLKQVQADDSILRKLDLSDAAYPVTAEQAAHAIANAVADPFELSQRARAIESKLAGDDRIVLTTRPSELADKLNDSGAPSEIKLWDLPYKTMRDQLRIPVGTRRQLTQEFEPFAWRPALWKARVLHFQGRRRSEVDSQGKTQDEIDDHRQAVKFYTDKQVRPPDRVIAEVSSATKQRIYSAAKANASYWVGLLLFDDGKFAAAEDWFRQPQLAAGKDEPWASGTRYNLARTYESQGKTKEAIKLYEQDDSPQRFGNRLRARALKENPPAASKAATEETGK